MFSSDNTRPSCSRVAQITSHTRHWRTWLRGRSTHTLSTFTLHTGSCRAPHIGATGGRQPCYMGMPGAHKRARCSMPPPQRLQPPEAHTPHLTLVSLSGASEMFASPHRCDWQSGRQLAGACCYTCVTHDMQSGMVPTKIGSAPPPEHVFGQSTSLARARLRRGHRRQKPSPPNDH